MLQHNASPIFIRHQHVFVCIIRPWRKSLPGSCRNRRCFSRWVESQSALTPPPRAASPSSTPSPAYTPLGSSRNLHTYALMCMWTWAHTHQRQRQSLCCLALILWELLEGVRSISGSGLCSSVCSSALQLPPTLYVRLSHYCSHLEGELWRRFSDGVLHHDLKTTKVSSSVQPSFCDWIVFIRISACRIRCF